MGGVIDGIPLKERVETYFLQGRTGLPGEETAKLMEINLLNKTPYRFDERDYESEIERIIEKNDCTEEEAEEIRRYAFRRD